MTIAPAAYTDQAKTGFSAYLQAGKTKVDLTDTGDGAELTIGWADSMTLHIDAYFEEGSDKIIEISLPQGMTFNLNNYGNARYVTSDLTNFLKEKIVSTDQSDDAKKSQVILGEQQYNGTLTLKFFSAGDNNDVSHVSFDVTVCPAYFTSWNNQVWESGTAWFYDVVDHPVTVTQYMDGKQILQKSVKSLKINNDDTKQYGTSWTLTYNPEVLSGGQTSGGEYFYVRPIPGGGNTRQAAYKYFSITYFVPEHARKDTRHSHGNLRTESPPPGSYGWLRSSAFRQNTSIPESKRRSASVPFMPSTMDGSMRRERKSRSMRRNILH